MAARGFLCSGTLGVENAHSLLFCRRQERYVLLRCNRRQAFLLEEKPARERPSTATYLMADVINVTASVPVEIGMQVYVPR
jgi:hypothetical protein